VYIPGYPVLHSLGAAAAERKHNANQLLEDLTPNMFRAANDFQRNCVIPVNSQLAQTFSSSMSCLVVIFLFLVKFPELHSFINEI
jgi:hypothetical protein